MKFLLYILSLWISAPTCPLLSFVLGLAFFRSHENPLQFLFNVNDTNDPIKKKTWISSSSAEIAGELQFIKAGHQQLGLTIDVQEKNRQPQNREVKEIYRKLFMNRKQNSNGEQPGYDLQGIIYIDCKQNICCLKICEWFKVLAASLTIHSSS